MKVSVADKDIVNTFQANFGMLSSKPLVLYGIGEKTRILVEQCDDYNIVGLMDKNSAGCVVYGKKVLSPEDVIGISQHIIIISNFASADLIYQRIAYLEKEHGINIYHLNGTKPKDSYIEPSNNYQSGTGFTYEDLKHCINKSDIVSFDIFDTILMRKCLSPINIFQIVERKLGEGHGLNIKFTEKRIEAEKIAYTSFGNACNIHSIYSIMTQRFNISDVSADLCEMLEIQTELEYIVPRTIMVDALRDAKSLNKKVLLTSDMYFPCEIIKNILTSNNIVDWDELIISCDVNGSKYSGNLWKYYRELYKEKQILHIGDDDFADIKQAASYGINTFKVHSALDLLKISSISEVSNKAQTFDDKLLLGNTVACLFNNPFVLSKTNKINVDDFFNIGYSFLGPLILKFILFLINLSAKNNITKMLFLSRDSYILEKLYQNYIQKTGHDNLPKGIYFLTSRRALSVSSIENINGIADVFKHAPYVTRINFKQFLWATFGVQAHENDIYQNQLLYDLNAKELELHIISKYGVEIIEKPKEKRKCYVDYYLTLGIEENEKIGVVNFVSGGVTQHFFEKVFKNPNTNFIYFATLVNFEDVSCENEVHAVYGKKLSSYTDSTNALVRYYLTAES